MSEIRTSVGFEIEVNQSVKAPKGWQIDSEHCGVELKSPPLRSPRQILGALRAIDKVPKSDTTFDNAGVHIHFDFLNDATSEVLERRTSKLIHPGSYLSPLGTNKKYFWVDANGGHWNSPADHRLALASKASPEKAWYTKDSKVTESVKRFCEMGVTFWHIMSLLQHSDRLYNKYCHNLGNWDLDKLRGCRSVEEICNHPNLLQGHRRHAINPMAIRKYGTVEVRIVKGSLSAREIWLQTYFWGKVVKLAKSVGKPLPQPTSPRNILDDAWIFLDAIGAHGKMAGRLMERIMQPRFSPPIAKCYKCSNNCMVSDLIDIGLSRGLCVNCAAKKLCVVCGGHLSSMNACEVRNATYISGYGKRYACSFCDTSNLNKLENAGVVYIGGTGIGSGWEKLKSPSGQTIVFKGIEKLETLLREHRRIQH
jgi:hypothetical protein